MKSLFESLLDQSYVDREGQSHPMNLDNILVVAPYNQQVNLLKRVLPEGARVGTVDKFQGQEAEAVLVSMTTSSGQYLPRDIVQQEPSERGSFAGALLGCSGGEPTST